MTDHRNFMLSRNATKGRVQTAFCLWTSIEQLSMGELKHVRMNVGALTWSRLACTKACVCKQVHAQALLELGCVV